MSCVTSIGCPYTLLLSLCCAFGTSCKTVRLLSSLHGLSSIFAGVRELCFLHSKRD